MVISQNGKDQAAVIGIEEYQRYLADRDRRQMAEIRSAATGEFVEHDEVLREFGIS